MKKYWLTIFLITVLLQFSCGSLPIWEELDPSVPDTATPELVPGEENLEGTPTAVSPVPTDTKLPPTATQTVAPTTPTEVVYEEEPEELYLFKVQDGSPVMTQAWIHDCEWLGVGGQVFNPDGSPINDLVVEASGEINGESILGLALTGRSSPYGEGGYELKLLDAPIDTKDSAWIQLKDADGNPLSPQIFLETAAGCDQNLILLNFVVDETVMGNTLYFPLLQP